MTALMVAARDGKVACLKLLIRKGARINLSRNRVRENIGASQAHVVLLRMLTEQYVVLFIYFFSLSLVD